MRAELGPKIAVAGVASAVAIAGAVIIAACQDEVMPAGPVPAAPSLEIFDAAHDAAANPDFFFLPPLVGDPSADEDWDDGGFDGTLSPVVAICLVEDLDCASQQPTGFPLLYDMASGPGSETVRVSETDEHYIVNWHTNDFDLPPGAVFRVTVLVDNLMLGYADVYVGQSQQELKSLDTEEYIALKDGRTLPVKFRIEHGAVPGPVMISVQELIGVADAPQALLPAVISVQEVIGVTDAPRALPPAVVNVMEAVSVSDAARVVPPVVITVIETIAVTDVPRVVRQ